MFTAVLFIAVRKWKQSNVHQLMMVDQQNVAYPYNGTLFAHKEGDEVLTRTATWMDLEDITRRERSQTRKATCCVLAFTANVQNRPTHRDRQWTHGS